MTNAATTEADFRLQRLEAYLREDPVNPMLLGDLCDTAIACGHHERAGEIMATADQLGVADAAWTFRRARLALVRRDLQPAEGLLRELQARLGENAAIAHDLGYVRFLRGEAESARAIAEPWLDRLAVAPEDLDALQVLWLRSMHRLQRVPDAWAWVVQQRSARTLLPRAQGVASLLAMDAGQFGAARELAAAALLAVPGQPEALVAGACAALADGQTGHAFELLRQALAANPDDGRTWSAMALASLQARDFAAAESQFRRALASSMSEHVGTWHGLGWACLLRRDPKGARVAFERALQLDRNFAESHGAIGLLLLLEGRREEAQHHLRSADKLDPLNATGRFARALSAGSIRHRADAIALARVLLSRPGLNGGTLGDSVLAIVNSPGPLQPPKP